MAAQRCENWSAGLRRRAIRSVTLIHVVQPESRGGRGQVDVLEQAAAVEAVAGIVDVVDPDDPVGCVRWRCGPRACF